MTVANLEIGTRVKIKDTYRDERRTIPLVGTIKDKFRRPDWGGAMAHVVMFDEGEAGPPGGEFTADHLVAVR
jgi:hypothetical protein